MGQKDSETFCLSVSTYKALLHTVKAIKIKSMVWKGEEIMYYWTKQKRHIKQEDACFVSFNTLIVSAEAILDFCFKGRLKISNLSATVNVVVSLILWCCLQILLMGSFYGYIFKIHNTVFILLELRYYHWIAVRDWHVFIEQLSDMFAFSLV